MRYAFFLLLIGVWSTAPAQVVNSWTNSTSSYWEFQTNWSLGSLPDQSQSVCITNAGFKAVAIGPNTAQNFPTSMQIQGLQISTPSDSFNELLMNFSGFQVPLQTTGLSVYGTNSSVVLQSSMLRVVTNATQNSGNVFFGGIFNQGDFSRVEVQGFLSVGRFNPYAAYYLTNGSLSVPFIEVGYGLSQPAKFVQYGGTNNAGTLQLNTGGEYDLYGGEINSANITDGGGDYATATSFYQYGGTVTGNMVVNGNYTLSGGSRTGLFTMPAGGQRPNASMLQTGGTNSAFSMELGHGNQWGGAAFYTLSNGVVRVDSSTTFDGGQFSQYNGLHTIASNLLMLGPGGSLGPIYSDYFLVGGTLSIGGGLTANAAHFDQIGGTNVIAGTLLIGPIPPSQSTGYSLNGGTLNVRDIEIHANTYFSHTSGNIAQSGVLILGQGEWDAANGDYTLGPLRLAAPDTNAIGYHTNSAIIFPSGSSILRLANSSAQVWAPNAILYITNWNGSTSGGGATRLYFGSNSSGLTTAQLAQTTFANPGGLPAGNYPAKILSTGEIVPDTSGTPPPGLVNNWLNPGSDKWEHSSSWSLGIPPGSNQIVNITNAGYKAVNIDNITVGSFSNSLTVSNLTVSAPTNGLGTLLLNYAGLGVPLKVRNNCVIGTNGTIDNFSSSFEVDGSAGGQLLLDGGHLTQVGGQTVVNAPVLVNSGSVNVTNGNMTLGNVILGTSGTFNQSGGSIAVASLSIAQGSYNLFDGILYALGGTAFPAAGTFNQYAGTNFGDVYMSGYPGTYRLLGGLLRGTNITASYSSIFSQGGGEVQATLVTLTGQSYQTTPNYFLTNGVLRVGTLGIHSCSFLQINGQVIITNPLSIYGYDMPVVHTGDFVYFANYTMQAGMLSCPSMTVTQYSGYVNNPFAGFTQNGGTNIIAGDLSLAGTTYSLAAGCLLQTANTVITNGTAAQGVGTPQGVFQHQSGTHKVTGALSVDPGNIYQINGGSLSAGAMSVHGLLAIGNSNGTPTVSCSGLFDLGGTVLPAAVQVQAGAHHLGSLRLTGNSSLQFGNGPVALNFDSSSATGWSNGVSLVISNWQNPGNTHVYFGNNASTLTASQLAQITFSNPGGFSPGNYGARLLSTGELVPVLQPTLQLARYGSSLVLTWPSGYQLLSATNVTGPYAPVSGAFSPWTNSLSKPLEFFKLQGL